METPPSILLDLSLYKEAAFFPTLGQSTIHGLTHVPSQSSIDCGEERGCRKYDLLVASLLPGGESFSSARCCNLYSFSSGRKRLATSTKSFDFMYLPVADIVCIKAFYDDQSQHYVVSMGLVKDNSNAGPVQVYTKLIDAVLSEVTEKSDGEEEGKQYDSEVPPSTNSADETQGHKPATSTTVNSVFGVIDNASACSLFPELKNLPLKVVTFMDFLLLLDGDTHYRMSAFGTLDGWIGVGLVKMAGPGSMVLRPFFAHCPRSLATMIVFVEIFANFQAFYSTSHDSAITKLKFFRQFDQNSTSPSDVSLLVCSGLEPAVVYRCPFQDNPDGGKLAPSSRLVLPQSADFDHVNCACVADLDFDGLPEIVVGTFGQQLLFYDWTSDPHSPTEGSYVLVHQRRMVGAVHSLECGGECDFLGDGTRCIAVLTSLGLHLLQCSHLSDFCVPLLAARLRSLPPNFRCESVVRCWYIGTYFASTPSVRQTISTDEEAVLYSVWLYCTALYGPSSKLN
ncbi:Kaptin [Echinococcus granulosus]|uniref:Kaptin n=1 Tax=Echinococcus granulosus TaxID=6210 RepID=W6V2P8_ECHGR|nr:Kaptin [Echinococcus granulosus]EUB60239.1 Kaptin [Echinococcus granulosus]